MPTLFERRAYPVVIANQGGVVFPYTYTPGADGALPSPWVGSTFAVSSSLIINTPTLGAELLTDPGLEANYTAGKCDTLTMGGTPTVTESADVHGGSKAQKFLSNVGTNQYLRFPAVTPVQGTWYQGSLWQKLTDGASSADFTSYFSQANMFPSGGASAGNIFSTAAYTQRKTSFLINSTAALYCITHNSVVDARGGIVDDCSLKAITASSLFAMVSDPASRAATVKIKPNTIADNSITAVICWANASSNPTTYVMALYRQRYSLTTIEIGLMKVVNGVPTQLINPTATVAVANADLEIRPVDNDTVALYYNNTQISTNKDIADVPGAYAGMFISGGNSVKSFFVG